MMKNSVKTVSNIFVIIFLSKLFGQVREMIVAHYYGTGVEATAFSAATQIPLNFFDIILGLAIVSAFVPVFNEYYQKEGIKKANEFSDNFISIVILISLIISAFGVIFSKEIVGIIVKGLDTETLLLTSKLLKILFPALIFTALAYSFAGVLQSFGEFNLPAAMSLVSNLIAILYFLIFNKKVTILGLSVAMLVGWAMQFVILLPKLNKFEYKYKFRINFKHPGMIKVYKLAGPVFLSSWVQPINVMINLYLASFVNGGSAVPAINYANKLYLIIASVFAVSVTNMVLPSLSRYYADKDMKNCSVYIENSVKAASLFLIPVMAVFVIFSEDIVRIIYQSGTFDETSTALTSCALRFYSFGMLGYALTEIMNKSFYAMQKSTIPMKIAFVTIAVNVACSFSLYRVFGVAGLTVSAAVAANLSAVLLFLMLKKNFEEIKSKFILITIIKGLISVIPSVLISYPLYKLMSVFIKTKAMNFLVLAIVTVVFFAVYLVSLLLLKTNEVKELKKIFMKSGDIDEK